MFKNFNRVLAIVVAVIFCFGLVCPVAAAPTLRQQVTYVDNLVKMAEGMNNGCSSLIAVYDDQISGTSTVSDGDAFGNYFSCAFSSIFSFYAEHWAPSSYLKNTKSKMIQLADGLLGSLRYIVADPASTDLTAFKSNVAKNKNLIAVIKKEIATFKKRFPGTIKADETFLKKVAAKEKTFYQSNLSADLTASCGKDVKCFEAKYAKCAPAWIRFPSVYSSLEYKIIGKVKGGCKLQISEKIDYLGLLAGKQMTCVYNNKNEFYQEARRVSDEIIKNNKQKICSGTLVDYSKKQYKFLKTNPLAAAVLNFVDEAKDIIIDNSNSTTGNTNTTTTTVTVPTPSTTITCGNSSGNDSNYTLCLNDTFTHLNSGITIHLYSFEQGKYAHLDIKKSKTDGIFTVESGQYGIFSSLLGSEYKLFVTKLSDSAVELKIENVSSYSVGETTGGDGIYRISVGDTITHTVSGVNLFPRYMISNSSHIFDHINIEAVGLPITGFDLRKDLPLVISVSNNISPIRLTYLGVENNLQVIKIESPTTTSGGNSAGGDGMYSAWTGATINHDVSGVVIKVVYYTYGGGVVNLSFTGVTETIGANLRMGQASTTVHSVSGKTLEISMPNESERNGATINIKTL